MKLPAEERAIRQVQLDIVRLATRGGKRNWRKIRAYLDHPAERVRAFVREVWDPWRPEEASLVAVRNAFGDWVLIEAVFEWEWLQAHWNPGEPPKPEEEIPWPDDRVVSDV